MKPVLLLVDLQNDFLRVGDLEPHPGSIVAAAANLLKVCRTSAVPVIHVWSTINKSGANRMPHRKKNARFGCRRLYHLAEADRRFAIRAGKLPESAPRSMGPANREFFTRMQAIYFA